MIDDVDAILEDTAGERTGSAHLVKADGEKIFATLVNTEA
jgi:hypothetical protein